ncbi:MAG: PIN domain-containing protein [Gammaproteobacteria bacterium]|nr:PIN domain-containing protein [Gammaproteobacteria bacterium]
MKRLFVDTSAWFAYANRADREHRKIKDILASFDGRLVTSNFVVDETVTLFMYRLGHRAAVSFGEALFRSRTVDLVRLTPEDEQAAWLVFAGRQDKKYSFTDCTSFALMRRLGLTTALALDDDFAQEGFEVLPAK